MMTLDYATYLDRILGGWMGKSIGGAVGARFEGHKGWIEIDAAKLLKRGDAIRFTLGFREVTSRYDHPNYGDWLTDLSDAVPSLQELAPA